MRRSPKVTEVLPILYLRGLSTGDFAPALTDFFGTGAGLSASTVQRLTASWRAEHARWQTRDLSGLDYVYCWADGIYPNVRLPDPEGHRDELCLLVIVGARVDGTKELIAVAEGYRESTEAWAGLLRELSARGMRAPELMVGDGALGLWAGLRQVWPSVRQQLCWVHKTARAESLRRQPGLPGIPRVLSALPKRLHARAKQLIHGISYAATRTEAIEATRTFADELSQFPKAVVKVTDHLDRLLTFLDFPAEHHKHLRTTNVVSVNRPGRGAARAVA